MKFQIILQILFELLSKKIVSASYLAQKYEVSTRSIYRYISELEYAGVPLYTIRGNGGGFSLVDTYRLTSTFMTSNEFEQTINALTSLNENLGDNLLYSAINKLKATVKNEYSKIDFKSGNLIIDNGPWGDSDGHKRKLTILQDCINNNFQLDIKYHDRNGKVTSRIINPYFLIFKQGLWYVYAFCNLRNTFRIFKTGRIEEATILNSNFKRENINKNDVSLDFVKDNVTELIEMQVESSVLSDVEEWLGIENVKEENGKNIARVKLPYENGLISKIMSYGCGIKVLSPQKLIEDIKNNAHALLNNY